VIGSGPVRRPTAARATTNAEEVVVPK